MNFLKFRFTHRIVLFPPGELILSLFLVNTHKHLLHKQVEKQIWRHGILSSASSLFAHAVAFISVLMPGTVIQLQLL